ncbi:DUF3667 domain-containing protein [Marinicauda sp. Alg238-R41]|uniref:DUF3667 domain-containing protein n=1 Tax=Marinicauda sp. Alg238-R41 TaxID=2993447 RepID=UPI0022DEE0FF|nr:DUF3667 domain-containing protein [Marinicauda sp. Alg238-R41]
MGGDDFDQTADTVTEHVAAAGLGVTARPGKRARLDPDLPEGVCQNCETELEGPVCHNCGQVDDTYHRSAGALVRQIIDGFINLDGRVARTLPRLMVRPGRVSRDYLSGKRARFIPPFRLYIVASLLMFLVAGLTTGDLDLGELRVGGPAAVGEHLTDAFESGELEETEYRQAMQSLGLSIPPGVEAGRDVSESGPDPQDEVSGQEGTEAGTADDPAMEQGAAVEPAPGGGGSDAATARRYGAEYWGGDDGMARLLVPEDYGKPAPDSVLPYRVRRYLADRVLRINEDPARLWEASLSWIPRILFVLVPVYAGLLGLTYIWRRGFFYYDHLIVSVHFHSALFLALTFAILIGHLIGAGWATLGLLIYSNVYLYKVHRVVYERSRFTSILRTLTLDVVYFFVMLIAIMAVVLLGILSA